MRVIAGRYKGRRLAAPTWDGLRPTSDRLKETVFNVLRDRVAGARVLDGFAGAGALGIEALSRGALHVTFVDRDPRAAALIEANLAHCGISNGYVMIRRSFDEALRHLPADQQFDVMLLDPPYDFGDLPAVLSTAAERLAATGLVVLEHRRRRGLPVAGVGLALTRTLTAGDSALAFYQLAGHVSRSPAEDA